MFKSHGLTAGGKRKSTWIAWQSMRARCFNGKAKDYPRYGGRGITVCERWLKFENFLADMGECPIGLTLDRKNNNGNYEPENCQWATRVEQQNNRRNNRYLVSNGVSKSAREWEKELGLSKGAIQHRLKAGWSMESATTTPKGEKHGPRQG